MEMNPDGQEPSFNDDELRLIVKSLSITHDALSNKLGRLKGRYYDEAVHEYHIVDTALTKARSAQSLRISPLSK
jgi:hypothetical protein